MTSVRPSLVAALAILLAVCPLVGYAQRAADQPQPSPAQEPAHLAVVDGTVTLEREGLAQPADVNVGLLAGDRLRTERGRAEVLFGDGSALDLDNDTSVDLLSDSLIRLRTGRLRLAITRVTNEVAYRIDGAGSSAMIQSAGDFEVSVSNARRTSPELDLAVFRGTAELSNSHGRTLVRAGMHAWAREDAEPSAAAAFNSSAADDFDHWVEDQRDARTGAASSQYLPAEMRSYSGTFDAYGTWGNELSYGTVWYPQVNMNWQPYSDGYWSAYGSYGWFWVGPTVWSWPTHHYGRWGVSSGRWFWVPDRKFAPAWVSWATSPGHVGWCPLGVDGRPVGWSKSNFPEARRGWTMATANQFSAASGPGAVVRPQRTGNGAGPESPSVTLTEHTTAPVVPSARPGADTPLRSPTGVRVVGVPRLDVGQPAGMSRPGAVDTTPAVPRSGAIDATPTVPSRTTREQAAPSRAWPASPSPPDDRARAAQDRTAPDQDRTPSWQSRPGEPRPAPTVARPGFWYDQPSPSRSQPRPPSDSPQMAPPAPGAPAASGAPPTPAAPDIRTSPSRTVDRPTGRAMERSSGPDRPVMRGMPDRSTVPPANPSSPSRTGSGVAVPRYGTPPPPATPAKAPGSSPPSRSGSSSQSAPARGGRGGV